MKQPKKYIHIAILFVCLAMGVSLLAVGFAAANPTANLFFRAGQIAKEKLNDGIQTAPTDPRKMYAVGNDFSISDSYFNSTVKELMNTGYAEDDAHEMAKKILFEKFSLYSAAVNANCVVSDEHIYQVIENTKAGVKQASNKSDFYNYLNGIGLSESEYWESQFENVKMYESIAAYKDSCYQKYISSQMDTQSDLSSSNALPYWEDYLADIVSLAIDEQNITVSVAK